MRTDCPNTRFRVRSVLVLGFLIPSAHPAMREIQSEDIIIIIIIYYPRVTSLKEENEESKYFSIFLSQFFSINSMEYDEKMPINIFIIYLVRGNYIIDTT